MPVKVPEGRGLLQVVAVVVTKSTLISAFVLLLVSLSVGAAILPEERADVLYHNYNGGGITIDGPSVLVRKNFADKVSVSANYYVDNISSASIDAITLASPYAENRVQKSAGIDYLHEKSIITYNYTRSIENDYKAITHFLGVSQEMFGGLTTVSLGYALGDNVVMKTGDDSFRDVMTFRSYRASVAQVLTKDLILALNYDIITDQGYLNNPYRQVRYISPSSATGFSFQTEVYPRTRTTNAASFTLRYYLPYRAAVFGGYRYFIDSWGIQADTYEIGYEHPYDDNWSFETNFRFYVQSQADFYSDLFPFENAQNYLARDKEMSAFSDYTLGIGVRYEFENESLPFFEKGSANFYLSHISFNFDNFRDVTVGDFAVGSEPLYRYSANVMRLYFSFWF